MTKAARPAPNKKTKNPVADTRWPIPYEPVADARWPMPYEPVADARWPMPDTRSPTTTQL